MLLPCQTRRGHYSAERDAAISTSFLTAMVFLCGFGYSSICRLSLYFSVVWSFSLVMVISSVVWVLLLYLMFKIFRSAGPRGAGRLRISPFAPLGSPETPSNAWYLGVPLGSSTSEQGKYSFCVRVAYQRYQDKLATCGGPLIICP